jgi:membrane protease YdiL (CAAX protease family)
MPEKLTGKDYRFLVICVLIAAVCFGVGLKYFYVAFPEASIDFKVTQAGSEGIAKRFLEARGYRLAGYRHASEFSYDDEAKVFLERELGLAQANPLFGTRVRIWRWAHRWFVPLQKEEFKVEVSPHGEVVSFDHTVPETLPGKNLSPSEARALAEDYLPKVAGRDTSTLEFVEASTEGRPKRTDHTFTWKEKGFEVKDGTYRIQVTVQGGEVAGYDEYLHVPEAWTRAYEKLRSLNQAAGIVDSLFFVLLGLGILVVLGIRIARKDVKYLLALGVGAIGTILVFLNILNSLASTFFSYPTTESFGSFLASHLAQALFGALAAGGMFFVLTAAAEPLYRRAYPDKLSLVHLFSPRGIRTRTFFKELVLGLVLTFFFFAYQIVFYLLANKLGAWSPADIPYTDLLNTKLPWIAVLLMGFMPSVSEEFIFRMFSIPFLKGLLKWTPLAVVLSAFIWGFGHATYPNQPFYIRGLEVGLAGIIVGLIMLRWGILATLVWHFTVDALYTALLLLRSSNPYFIVSGAISAGIMLLPLVFCIVAYLARRGFISEQGMLNRDACPPEEAREVKAKETVEAVPTGYHPLSTRTIAVWAVIALASLALFLIKVPKVGDYIRFKLTRQQAQAVADKALTEQGVATGSYYKVTTENTVFGPLTSKYILQRKDIAYLNRFWEQGLKVPTWSTRYFKPLQKEEFRVSVNPKTGEIVGIAHELPEEEPGADLPEDSAKALAVGVLRGMGIDPAGYDLKRFDSEKKKARRDYDFTWEAKEGSALNVGEAKFRAYVKLAGSEVASYGTTLKLPEAWIRERTKQTLWKTACGILAGVIGLFFLVVSLFLFIFRIRDRKIPWRRVLAFAAVLPVVAALGWLNRLPVLYAGYDTSMALSTFSLQMLVFALVAVVGAYLFGILILGFAFGVEPGLEAVLAPKGRKQYARDVLLGVAVLLVLGAGAMKLDGILDAKFTKMTSISGLPVPEGASTLLPFLGSTILGLRWAVYALALYAMGAYLWRHKLRWLFFGLAIFALVLTLLAMPEFKTPQEIVLGLGVLVLYTLAGLAIVRYLGRNNALFYPCAGFLLPCAGNAVKLFSQSSPWFMGNGIVLIAIMGLVVLWLLIRALREAGREGG